MMPVLFANTEINSMTCPTKIAQFVLQETNILMKISTVVLAAKVIPKSLIPLKINVQDAPTRMSTLTLKKIFVSLALHGRSMMFQSAIAQIVPTRTNTSL